MRFQTVVIGLTLLLVLLWVGVGWAATTALVTTGGSLTLLALSFVGVATSLLLAYVILGRFCRQIDAFMESLLMLARQGRVPDERGPLSLAGPEWLAFLDQFESFRTTLHDTLKVMRYVASEFRRTHDDMASANKGGAGSLDRTETLRSSVAMVTRSVQRLSVDILTNALELMSVVTVATRGEPLEVNTEGLALETSGEAAQNAVPERDETTEAHVTRLIQNMTTAFQAHQEKFNRAARDLGSIAQESTRIHTNLDALAILEETLREQLAALDSAASRFLHERTAEQDEGGMALP